MHFARYQKPLPPDRCPYPVLQQARLPFRSRWAVLSAANIYGAIARKVVARGPHAWDSRTSIGKRRKLVFMAQALAECAIPPAPRDRDGLWIRPR